MPGPAFLRDDRVGLHTVEEEDLEFLQRLQNDPVVRRGMTTNAPENGPQVETWFDEHVSNEEEGAQFVVCPTPEEPDDEPEPVGYVSLFDVERPADRGEIAYSIAPAHQGEGYATAAAALLVEYALRERRLHKVVARALATNGASRRVLEKVGFVEEERQREEMLVAGEHVDVIRHGVLADEWDGARGP